MRVLSIPFSNFKIGRNVCQGRFLDIMTLVKMRYYESYWVLLILFLPEMVAVFLSLCCWAACLKEGNHRAEVGMGPKSLGFKSASQTW